MHITENDDGTVTAATTRATIVGISPIVSVTFTPDTADEITAAAMCLPGFYAKTEDVLYLELSRVCRAPAAYVEAQDTVAAMFDELDDDVEPEAVEKQSEDCFIWRDWRFRGEGAARLFDLATAETLTLAQLVEEAQRAGVYMVRTGLEGNADVSRVARLGDYCGGTPHWAGREVNAYFEQAIAEGNPWQAKAFVEWMYRTA